ncbi:MULTISPECIES: host attachment protein [Mesorhizobium]|uniref:host attachment protein n=1 Tax=Mesorhizobium TaxID=68287 RepID=UPI002A23AE77|nr:MULTISPECIES: host attachment protein [unclassified Mesorhizobium]MDX8449469.1 host attachment protein [Mesorhizobium sp. VK3C]MDX8463710.1 host attachment protein [Mesorhizobium sp. VK2D]
MKQPTPHRAAGIAVQPPTPNATRLREDDFAASIASYLNRRVREEACEHLLVIADPRTLGEMRKVASLSSSSEAKKVCAAQGSGETLTLVKADKPPPAFSMNQ